jgi:hypothetical protein
MAAAVVDSRCLELWIQSGIPEDGDLVFNVHIRNLATTDWEVSYRLSQFASLDIEINKYTDALRDVAFPTINKEALNALITNKKYLNKLKDLEHCRMSLEQWVYYVISRCDIFPIDLRNIVENFFLLPSGPHQASSSSSAAASAAAVATVQTKGGGGGYKSPTLADLHHPSSGNEEDPGGSSVWDDEVSETKTVWTVGSLDENGVPKKKKKRLIKGLQRRVSNILGTTGPPLSSSATATKQKEQFGVDFSGVNGSDISPGPPVPSKSVVSGVSSTGSDHGRPSAASSASVQYVQPSKLLKVRVVRGGEKSRGQPEYEVCSLSSPKPSHSSLLFRSSSSTTLTRSLSPSSASSPTLWLSTMESSQLRVWASPRSSLRIIPNPPSASASAKTNKRKGFLPSLSVSLSLSLSLSVSLSLYLCLSLCLS